jgi:hypothetical protein
MLRIFVSIEFQHLMNKESRQDMKIAVLRQVAHRWQFLCCSLAFLVAAAHTSQAANVAVSTAVEAVVSSKSSGSHLPSSAKAGAPVALESVQLLALGVQDSSAVVMLPSRQLILLKQGDTIPGTQAVVKEVLPTKLVLEEFAGSARQLVWLYKAEANATRRLDRFASEGVPSYGVRAPQAILLRGDDAQPDKPSAPPAKAAQ